MRPVTCEDQTPTSMVFTDYTTDEDQDEACSQDASGSQLILSMLLVKIVLISRIVLKPTCRFT